MALYSYKARDEAGKIITDAIESTSRSTAAALLKGQGLQVMTVKSVGGISSIFAGKVSVAEKAAFCRFMGTMLRSGMSLPEAVEIIRQETKNKKMQQVLADLSNQTQKGKSVSSVLEGYKNDFDPVFLTMIRAGEESGTLEQSFDYLSAQLTQTHELTQMIKGSLMYPAVIIVAMIGNGLMMAIFVLPRIAGAFLKLDVPLPAYTRIILGMGQFFGNNVALVLIMTFLLGASAVASFIIPKTRKIIIRVLAKMPVISFLVKQIDVARFARTLSTLLKSGVPIIEALDVSAESISQPYMKAEAKRFSAAVSKGESLSSILTLNKRVFPTIMIQTIRAGEQSGSLEVVLAEVAVFYEKEVEFSLKRLTSLLEPVLMLLIGVVVGVMVIMMIAPIYSIIGGLQTTIQSP
ncbi:hypothetical protein A2801_02455 [Candidatus Woesebacteria bacterium RIFCSPHIGHO2_01_FULL_41_10]|uniref:Type II secretion system protein GspF domain-containing protein n=1 Tax=Candidatus Woesebacteria bacterium RIFCSPHIGHO2_01_FULL_41_10 TaxID=1802500 RepID=A0A1F7YLR8_9BACT|nr:MAG: hypothetical protein A2801_02455 [Candidatus Woesebacteria bacterium RIFCSPHIGHO2_01_FULL_41_10]